MGKQELREGIGGNAATMLNAEVPSRQRQSACDTNKEQ